MIVVRHVSSLRSTDRPWVIAPGRFDGVHLGHQAVLNRLVEVARTSLAGALVLSSHDRKGAALGCLRQRLEHLAASRIDTLCLAHGSFAASGTGKERLLAALPADLQVQALVVGAAQAAAFARWSQDRRTFVETMPMVLVDGAVVTSDAVRAAVSAGDLAHAARLLGRPYAVGGRVVRGLRRGRQLGFPTANLRVRGLQLPPNGVYAGRFGIGARVCDGVANLGFNPTFANAERSLETHVFDFDEDLYGRYAEVTFVAYLRGEQKFAGIDALIEQIRRDCAEARRRLS